MRELEVHWVQTRTETRGILQDHLSNNEELDSQLITLLEAW